MLGLYLLFSTALADEPVMTEPMVAGSSFYGVADSWEIGGSERISLDLVNADIHGVLRFFGQTSGLNIIAGDDVSGRVTVQLTDVPWDQAFQAVLYTQGLQAVWMDSQALRIHSF